MTSSQPGLFSHLLLTRVNSCFKHSGRQTVIDRLTDKCTFKGMWLQVVVEGFFGTGYFCLWQGWFYVVFSAVSSLIICNETNQPTYTRFAFQSECPPKVICVL